ncbi:MAG TPA: GNAT family N-acetyltransferase [Xanthobacteraceae bacterium]
MRVIDPYIVGVIAELDTADRRLGLRECVLETTQTARRFYESLGYTKIEEAYPLSLTGLPATGSIGIVLPMPILP